METVQLLGTKEVAERYGVDTREVLYATRRKLIKGHKVGWVWIYSASELPRRWPVQSRGRAKVA